MSSFKVRYSEDLAIQDDYEFVYTAFFRDYRDNPNIIVIDKPITVTILDPCERPWNIQASEQVRYHPTIDYTI